jgi:hypothetical protein
VVGLQLLQVEVRVVLFEQRGGPEILAFDVNAGDVLADGPGVHLGDGGLDQEGEELSVEESSSGFLRVGSEFDDVEGIQEGVQKVLLIALDAVLVKLQAFEIGTDVITTVLLPMPLGEHQIDDILDCIDRIALDLLLLLLLLLLSVLTGLLLLLFLEPLLERLSGVLTVYIVLLLQVRPFGFDQPAELQCCGGLALFDVGRQSHVPELVLVALCEHLGQHFFVLTLRHHLVQQLQGIEGGLLQTTESALVAAQFDQSLHVFVR